MKPSIRSEFIKKTKDEIDYRVNLGKSIMEALKNNENFHEVQSISQMMVTNIDIILSLNIVKNIWETNDSWADIYIAMTKAYNDFKILHQHYVEYKKYYKKNAGLDSD